LGSTLDPSSEFSWTPSCVGVGLSKAATVFEQLDFLRPFVADVPKALLGCGLDDLAA
jgi:hypothetical protein